MIIYKKSIKIKFIIKKKYIESIIKKKFIKLVIKKKYINFNIKKNKIRKQSTIKIKKDKSFI